MMPNVFSIIGQAWDFFRKQPVLNQVTLWLIALPTAALFSLSQLREWHPAFGKTTEITSQYSLIILVAFAELTLSILMIWGIACILLVGKKLLKNSAGRTRSSFKKVRKEAGSFVANIFLTDILRGCFTIFWSILFIVPGIIYAIRTAFYQIAIVCEGKEFRSALLRSKQVVQGQTWRTFWYLLGIACIVFLPALFVTVVTTVLVEVLDNRMLVAVNIVSGGVWSLAITLFTLTNIILYTHLQKIAAKNAAPLSL